MDLWIRSQNKETLVKVDDLCIDNNEDNKKVFDIVQGCILLGTYITKERALEILDEIQETLLKNDKSDLKIIQYEMPKE